MTALILVVVGLVAISFFCSILESALLSVTDAHIETLIARKRPHGKILRRLKQQINKPLSAILTLNTISNSAGAAIAGSMALSVWGNKWVALFSAALTLVILIFSEIIPKTLGATYWKGLSPFTAWSLRIMVVGLTPLVVPVNLLARLISGGHGTEVITREDVLSSIRLAYNRGVVDSSEYATVTRVLGLKKIAISKVMTPRTVVYSLEPERTAGSVLNDAGFLQFSRIPLYDAATNKVQGLVLRRNIILRVAEDKPQTVLRDMASEPVFIPGSLSVYTLLDRLITQNLHFVFVINEYGDYSGIATMEDAIETLIGREIVDESDKVVDMRKLARELGRSGSDTGQDVSSGVGGPGSENQGRG